MPSTATSNGAFKPQPKRTMSLQNVMPSGNLPQQYHNNVVPQAAPMPQRRTSLSGQSGHLHPSLSAPQINNNMLYNQQQQQQQQPLQYMQQSNSYDVSGSLQHQQQQQQLANQHPAVANSEPVSFQLHPLEFQPVPAHAQSDVQVPGASGHLERMPDQQNQAQPPQPSPEQPVKSRQR